MDTVKHYLELLQQKGEQAILQKYAHPFLLYPEKYGKGSFTAYHTQMVSRPGGAGGIAGVGKNILQFRVLSPNPELGTSYPRKMIVGRSPEREFCVDHSTVSKRHAVLIYDADRNSYRLGDAGSTNGTFLNGQSVEAGRPVYIKDGSVVTFGDCDFLFFSPRGFVELLKRLGEENQPGG